MGLPLLGNVGENRSTSSPFLQVLLSKDQPMSMSFEKIVPAPTRREWLCIAGLGLAFSCCGQRVRGQVTGQSNPRLTAYDQLMGNFMREHRPPGAALAVTYQGRLVYARGFGHADLEKRETVRPTSLFRIASISKPFTATAVMHLVDKRKLKLDDRVFS